MKLHNDDKYFNECKALNLLAIPYIGVYSENYTFGFPLDARRRDSMLLPDKLEEKITEEIRANQMIDIEYYVLTYDLSFIYEKHHSNIKSYLRVNLVPHPYIFYNLNTVDKEHTTYVFASLFTMDEIGNTAILDTHEEDGLRINPPQLISRMNQKEVILHPVNGQPAISPNNCAFLLNLHCRITSIYLTLAVTYGSQIVKFLVVQLNILPSPSTCVLFHPLKNSSLFNSDSHVHLEEYKQFYKNILQKMYGFFSYKIVEGKENSKEMIRLIFLILFNDTMFYYNDLCRFVEHYLPFPQMGEAVLFDSGSPLYTVEVLCKYFTWHVSQIENFFNSYSTKSITEVTDRHLSTSSNYYSYKYIVDKLINQLGESLQLQNEMDTFDIKSDSFIENYFMKEFNPQKEKFEAIMTAALNGSLHLVQELTDNLPLMYRNFLFFKVWERKGKLHGIHNDFGRLSFLNSDQIALIYHCNLEETVEILLEIISIIDTFDNV